jgi:hypothetical protein
MTWDETEYTQAKVRRTTPNESRRFALTSNDLFGGAFTTHDFSFQSKFLHLALHKHFEGSRFTYYTQVFDVSLGKLCFSNLGMYL